MIKFYSIYFLSIYLLIYFLHYRNRDIVYFYIKKRACTYEKIIIYCADTFEHNYFAANAKPKIATKNLDTAFNKINTYLIYATASSAACAPEPAAIHACR